MYTDIREVHSHDGSKVNWAEPQFEDKGKKQRAEENYPRDVIDDHAGDEQYDIDQKQQVELVGRQPHEQFYNHLGDFQ